MRLLYSQPEVRLTQRNRTYVNCKLVYISSQIFISVAGVLWHFECRKSAGLPCDHKCILLVWRWLVVSDCFFLSDHVVTKHSALAVYFCCYLCSIHHLNISASETVLYCFVLFDCVNSSWWPLIICVRLRFANRSCGPFYFHNSYVWPKNYIKRSFNYSKIIFPHFVEGVC